MDNKSSSSYGTSWAEQWDSGPDPGAAAPTSKHGGSNSLKNMMNKDKMNAGLEKTKAVAATSFNKVKKGTNFGVNWIKEKYNNRSNNKP